MLTATVLSVLVQSTEAKRGKLVLFDEQVAKKHAVQDFRFSSIAALL
jgi:hypothetical protein